VGGGVALALADAIRRRRRVHFAYRSFSGEATRRDVSPYGLVVHSGRWYLAAHDHVRQDLRTFRVDRVSSLALAREAPLAPAADFDAVAHVSRSLARVPWTWEVEVLLDLPLEDAAARLPATLAELAPHGSRTRVRMRVGELGWMAGVLAGLDCSFEVVTPAELRGSVAALADRLAGCV
jgi:predicted DNA-binding transcriptional regulator YafY